MADQKHLRQRGNVWVMNLQVPPDVAQKFGQSYYTESLKTGDLIEARRKRDMILGRLQSEWERIRRDSTPGSLSWFDETATVIRDSLQDGSMSRHQANEEMNHVLNQVLDGFPRSENGAVEGDLAERMGA